MGQEIVQKIKTGFTGTDNLIIQNLFKINKPKNIFYVGEIILKQYST